MRIFRVVEGFEAIEMRSRGQSALPAVRLLRAFGNPRLRLHRRLNRKVVAADDAQTAQKLSVETEIVFFVENSVVRLLRSKYEVSGNI